MDSIYLDIETRYFFGKTHYVTIVGFYHEETGLRQLIWPDIDADSLTEALPPARCIYSYNGDNFDLPMIRSELGLDLRESYISRDLMRDCRLNGLRGGLKSVEQKLGIVRSQTPLENMEIQDCWSRWKHRNDDDALARLLKYNEDDVMNLIELRRKLGI